MKKYLTNCKVSTLTKQSTREIVEDNYKKNLWTYL